MLKSQILFEELLDVYGTDFYIIVATLRQKVKEKQISCRMYNIIMSNYDKWVNEYERSREYGKTR